MVPVQMEWLKGVSQTDALCGEAPGSYPITTCSSIRLLGYLLSVLFPLVWFPVDHSTQAFYSMSSFREDMLTLSYGVL